MTANHRSLEENDIKLIEAVKLTPSLFDTRSPDFRIAQKKEQEWQRIGEQLQISQEDAKRRFTSLRDRYSRELKQMRLHPEKNEFGKNDFFRSMDFLRPFVRKRRERQSNSLKQHDNSWDGNDVKIQTKVARLKGSSASSAHHIEDNETSSTQANFHEKLEVAEEEEYPFVEVDSEAYEEYVEHNPENVENPIGSNDAETMKAMTHAAQYALYQASTITPNTPPQHANLQAMVATSVATHNPLHQYKKIIHHPVVQQHQQQQQHQVHQATLEQINPLETNPVESEDDLFCKTIAVYLRQLRRRHKIKAKIEMFQILEKYIDLEEEESVTESRSGDTTATTTTTTDNRHVASTKNVIIPGKR